MTTLRFSVPGKAPALNDLLRAKGSGRHTYNGLKKTWTMHCAHCAQEALQQLRGPPPDPEGFVAITLHIIEQNRRRDPDNVAAGARKFVHDGLVKAGILGGDGWRHVSPYLVTLVEVGERPRIEVTVDWLPET